MSCQEEYTFLRFSDTPSIDNAGFVKIASNKDQLENMSIEDKERIVASVALLDSFTEGLSDTINNLVNNNLDLNIDDKVTQIVNKLGQHTDSTNLDIRHLKLLPRLDGAELRWTKPTYSKPFNVNVYKGNYTQNEKIDTINGDLNYYIVNVSVTENDNLPTYWVQAFDGEMKGRPSEIVSFSSNNWTDVLLDYLREKITETALSRELINSIYTGFGNALENELEKTLTKARDQITQAQNAIGNVIQTLRSNIDQEVLNVKQQLVDQGTNITNLERKSEGLAETIARISAVADGAVSGLQEEKIARATEHEAFARETRTQLSQVGNAIATARQELKTQSDQFQSQTNEFRDFKNTYGQNEARRTEQFTQLANEDRALSEKLRETNTKVEGASSKIQDLEQSQATKDKAIAKRFNSLRSSINGSHFPNYNFEAELEGWTTNSNTILTYKRIEDPSALKAEIIELSGNMPLTIYSDQPTQVDKAKTYSLSANLKASDNLIKASLVMMCYDKNKNLISNVQVDPQYPLADQKVNQGTNWVNLSGKISGHTTEWPSTDNSKMPIHTVYATPALIIETVIGAKVWLSFLDMQDTSQEENSFAELKKLETATAEKDKTYGIKFNEIKTQFQDVNSNLTANSQAVEQLQSETGLINGRLTATADKVEELQGSVGENEGKINKLKRVVVDKFSSTATELSEIKTKFRRDLSNVVQNPLFEKEEEIRTLNEEGQETTTGKQIVNSTDSWISEPRNKIRVISANDRSLLSEYKSKFPFNRYLKFWGNTLTAISKLAVSAGDKILIGSAVQKSSRTPNSFKVYVRYSNKDNQLIANEEIPPTTTTGNINRYLATLTVPDNVVNAELVYFLGSDLLAENQAIIISKPELRMNMAAIYADAKIEETKLSITNAEQALTKAIERHTSEFNGRVSQVQDEINTVSNAERATASKVSALETRADNAEGKLRTLEGVEARANSFATTKIEEAEGRVNGKYSNVTTKLQAIEKTVADEKQALTEKLETAEGKFEGLASTANSRIDGLERTLNTATESFAQKQEELKASFRKSSGANLFKNPNFVEYTNLTSPPKFWLVYNNAERTQLATSQIIENGGIDGANSVRLSWTGRINTTKGLRYYEYTWEKDVFYIFAICAKIPEGQPLGGNIVLTASNQPSWTGVEYLLQPDLSHEWQWTVMKAKKPNVETGSFNQFFITVSSNYLAESIDYCLPYASKGVEWTGYKAPDYSKQLKDIEAGITQDRQVRSTENEARARETREFNARLGQAETNITELTQAIVNDEGASSTVAQSLSAKFDKAKQQALKDAKEYADRKDSAINQAQREATSAKQKAEGATTRAERAETNAIQRAGELASTAKSEAIEDAERKANTARDEAKGYVDEKKREIDREVNSAKNSAQQANTKIDNLKVGGRNYLSATRTMLGWKKGVWSWLFYKNSNETQLRVNPTSDGIVTLNKATSNWASWYQNARMGRLANSDQASPALAKLQFDRKYTFSFEARKEQGDNNSFLRFRLLQVLPSGATVEVKGERFILTDQWQKFTVTFDNINKLNSLAEFDRWQLCLDTSSIGSFQFRKPKLEEGTVATDWTEAPEDIEYLVGEFDAKIEEYKNTSATDRASIASKVEMLESSLNGSVNLSFDSEFTEGLSKQDTKESSAVSGYVRGIVGQAPEGLEQLVNSIKTDGIQVAYVGHINTSSEQNGYFAQNVEIVPGLYQISMWGCYVSNLTTHNDIYVELVDERKQFISSSWKNSETLRILTSSGSRNFRLSQLPEKLSIDDNMKRVVVNIDCTNIPQARYIRVIGRTRSTSSGNHIGFFTKPFVAKIKKMTDPILPYSPGPTDRTPFARYRKDISTIQTETQSAIEKIETFKANFPRELGGSGNSNSIDAIINNKVNASARTVEANFTRVIEAKVGTNGEITGRLRRAEEFAQGIDRKVKAKIGLTVDANGRITGWEASENPDSNKRQSSVFKISADHFQLSNSAQTYAPFVIDTNDRLIYFNGKVRFTNVTDIDLGGRNYIRGSNTERTGRVATGSNGASLGIVQDFVNQSPSALTISCDVEIEGNRGSSTVAYANRAGCTIYVRYTDGSGTYLECWSAENGKRRVSKTLTVPAGKRIRSVDNCYLQTRIDAPTVKVSKPKLELGLIATDWSPAPEDVESSITTTANTVKGEVTAKIPKILTVQGTSNHLPTNGRHSFISIDGNKILQNASRGLRVVVLNSSTLTVLSNSVFDTYQTGNAPAFKNHIEEKLRDIGNNILIVISYDASSRHNDLVLALNSLKNGLGNSFDECLRERSHTSLAIIYQKVNNVPNVNSVMFSTFPENASITVSVLNGIVTNGEGANSAKTFKQIQEEMRTTANSSSTALEGKLNPLISSAKNQADKGVRDAESARSLANTANSTASQAKTTVDNLNRLVGTTERVKTIVRQTTEIEGGNIKAGTMDLNRLSTDFISLGTNLIANAQLESKDGATLRGWSLDNWVGVERYNKDGKIPANSITVQNLTESNRPGWTFSSNTMIDGEHTINLEAVANSSKNSQLYQIVPVKPNTYYLLSYWYQTHGSPHDFKADFSNRPGGWELNNNHSTCTKIQTGGQWGNKTPANNTRVVYRIKTGPDVSYVNLIWRIMGSGRKHFSFARPMLEEVRDNNISTPKSFKFGARITPGSIEIPNLAALSADVGHITAGTIEANVIKAQDLVIGTGRNLLKNPELWTRMHNNDNWNTWDKSGPAGWNHYIGNRQLHCLAFHNWGTSEYRGGSNMDAGECAIKLISTNTTTSDNGWLIAMSQYVNLKPGRTYIYSIQGIIYRANSGCVVEEYNGSSFVKPLGTINFSGAVGANVSADRWSRKWVKFKVPENATGRCRVFIGLIGNGRAEGNPDGYFYRPMLEEVHPNATGPSEWSGSGTVISNTSISTGTLSSISADMGHITAGRITSGSGNNGVVIDTNGMRVYEGGILKVRIGNLGVGRNMNRNENITSGGL